RLVAPDRIDEFLLDPPAAALGRIDGERAEPAATLLAELQIGLAIARLDVGQRAFVAVNIGLDRVRRVTDHRGDRETILPALLQVTRNSDVVRDRNAGAPA